MYNLVKEIRSFSYEYLLKNHIENSSMCSRSGFRKFRVTIAKDLVCVSELPVGL